MLTHMQVRSKEVNKVCIILDFIFIVNEVKAHAMQVILAFASSLGS